MIKRILTIEVIKQDNCKIIVDKITDMMAGINAKVSKKFPINIKINNFLEDEIIFSVEKVQSLKNELTSTLFEGGLEFFEIITYDKTSEPFPFAAFHHLTKRNRQY